MIGPKGEVEVMKIAVENIIQRAANAKLDRNHAWV
jgi:hypothetical protein